MRRVHLVYPHRSVISAPDAIGHQLAERLGSDYDVVLHDWDVNDVIQPRRGDVLLGHAHPAPWTVFRRSVGRDGWTRRILLQPYHHGDEIQMAWADPVVKVCDLFLAITGDYWFEAIARSPFAAWEPKMVHVDLAVDRRAFPFVKTAFNPPGERRYLYIGSTHWGKNTRYLSELAQRGDVAISWIGNGGEIEGVRALGRVDLSTDRGRAIVEEHDFLITVGRADANPVTILEAMSWGLVPVCTLQSGYAGRDGIVNVPLDDIDGALTVLGSLQRRPEADLAAAQQLNLQALDQHFNWERFAAQVVDAIESTERPSVHPTSLQQRLRRAAITLRSPHSPLHHRQLRKLLKRR